MILIVLLIIAILIKNYLVENQFISVDMARLIKYLIYVFLGLLLFSVLIFFTLSF
ncbi:hypothetical protein B2K_38790 [Paenibacillus mucilaginosus K02]|uniref:Uncharacterized protein n=1 Tax=Paenibacillus mucilaginosus K02 TaxID=997761 RepID=R9UP64_9BACL|nr:hypothetical protein B2K_38790 [Paenibacillus mucilaginosus K02]